VLTVGILGAGLIGGVHARAYRSCEGAQVAAVADAVTAKAEQLAAEHDARPAAGLDDLLDLGVDVVDVCTPPPHHAAPAIAALRAGRHVMCEKPIARTLADAREIAAAADSSSGLLMVGHVSRYEPDHRAAKDAVDGWEIGTLRLVKHSTASGMPGWSEAGWLADPEQSGGPLVDQAVHSFDFARWVIGSPAVRVHCMASAGAAGPATYTLTTVRYASGAIAHIECGWAHPASRGFKLVAEIVGTHGRLSWSYDHLMAGVLHPLEGDVEWWGALDDRGFTAELGAFFDAVRGGGPSPVPAAEAAESVRTALAALESATTGRTIDLTTWGLS
jgi:predicted dehydrogenase